MKPWNTWNPETLSTFFDPLTRPYSFSYSNINLKTTNFLIINETSHWHADTDINIENLTFQTQYKLINYNP